ncbi:unnamed protein product [Alternaria sp. RS040]
MSGDPQSDFSSMLERYRTPIAKHISGYDPFFADKDRIAAANASAAWKETFRRIFDSDEVLDHYVVQAATLLALYDFTGVSALYSQTKTRLTASECKHRTAWIKIGVAVNVAQAMHMMTEPPTELPFSAQEERRRTLWSIYLLDKLATCGRHRPSLFQDQSIRIQLPCNDGNFRTSTSQQVVSLEEFLRFVDFRVDHMETLAPTVVVASLLSQVANYTFQRDITGDRKAPWDHTSEYQTICSQLAQFETLFDCYGDIQATILNAPLCQSEPNVAKLTQFAVDSMRCSDLIDPALQSVPLELADIDQLYALCDYGTLSTTKTLSSINTPATNIESENIPTEREQSPRLDLEGYSGHIDGILPQIFGPTNTGTMIDNFSFALRDHGENEENISGTNYVWRL